MTLARQNQLNPSVARPSRTDFTVVVFEDERDGRSQIHVQKIDNQTGLTLWAPDGIAVSLNPEGAQTNPRAAYDSLGGVIVAWEDTRNDPTNGVKTIYVQRVLWANGQIDPAWPGDGIALSDPSHYAERPRISGTTNGAFVVWTDDAFYGYTPANRDVLVHQIRYDGQFPEVTWRWQSNRYGIPVAAFADADQLDPELVRDNVWRTNIATSEILTGVTIAFEDNREICPRTGDNTYQILAGSISCDGYFTYQDVPAAPTAEFEEQLHPNIVATYPTPTTPLPSVVITWEDERSNPGGDMYEVWAQRIDANANLFWGTASSDDGIVVSANLQDENRHVTDIWTRYISPSTYEPYVFVAWEYGFGGNGKDVYAALLDVLAGAVISPNGTSGDPICTEAWDQTQLSVDNVPDTPGSANMILGWRHETAAGSEIRYQSVSIPSWTMNKPQDGWTVTEAADYQNLPQVAQDVFVYEDARRNPIANDNLDDYNVYCQKPGYCVSAKEMEWCEMFAQWTSEAANMRQIVDPSDGSIFLAWDESRDGRRSVFVQKFDVFGVPRWENNGVRVSSMSYDAEFPDIALDDAGGVQVVYQMVGSTGRSEIWYHYINAIGTIITTTPHPDLPPRNGNLYHPVCIDNFMHAGDPAGPGILFACLNDNGIDIIRNQGWFSKAGGGNIPDVPNFIGGIQNHEDLMIVKDHIGGCYLMTHGTDGNQERINVTWCQETSPGTYSTLVSSWQNEDIGFAYFGGYDIEADIFPPVNAAYPHHANVAFSCAGSIGNKDIYAARFDGMRIKTNPAATIITNNGAGIDATTPALTTNGVLYQQYQNDQYDGMLLVWDEEYSVSGQVRYQVNTCHAIWFLGSQGDWPPTALSSPCAFLDRGLTAPSHPDISQSTTLPPYSAPTGYAVWQGFIEECNPARPREIISSYIVYGSAPPFNQGGQWGATVAPNFRRVDPGSGSYTQTRPMIRKSNEDGVVFWYDTRSGDACIAGTTIFDNGGDIDWRKTQAERRETRHEPSPALSGIFPQPVVLSLGEAVSIDVSLAEGDIVTLRLFDLLGRQIATLHEGELKAGRHRIVFPAGEAKRLLAPGVYTCALETKGRLSSRSMLVVR